MEHMLRLLSCLESAIATYGLAATSFELPLLVAVLLVSFVELPLHVFDFFVHVWQPSPASCGVPNLPLAALASGYTAAHRAFTAR